MNKNKKTLSIQYPELSSMWNTRANGLLDKYTKGSNKKFKWICVNNNDHTWISTISNMIIRKKKCLICESLYYKASDTIKQHWNNEKNGSMKKYMINSIKKVWWICPKNHEYELSIYNALKKKHKCHICNSFYYKSPDNINEYWDKSLNDPLTHYTKNCKRKVWLRCPNYQEHLWKVAINNLSKRKKIICYFCNSLYYNCSDIIINEWNEKKNGDIKKISENE